MGREEYLAFLLMDMQPSHVASFPSLACPMAHENLFVHHAVAVAADCCYWLFAGINDLSLPPDAAISPGNSPFSLPPRIVGRQLPSNYEPDKFDSTFAFQLC